MSYRADRPDDHDATSDRLDERDARSDGARSGGGRSDRSERSDQSHRSERSDRADQSEHPDDALVSQSEEAQRASSAARAFDVRRVIGGLFVVYGVIITVVGLTDTAAEIDKAQGIRINLWTGLAMLAFGGLMLLWQRLSPAEAPQPSASDSADADRPPTH